jgi:hypothetical protein
MELFMLTKKKIIITIILLSIGIVAAVILLPKIGTVKIEKPNGYEMFYLKNPDVKLENLPNKISNISTSMPGDFIGILGFAEYPLIIRDAWIEFWDFTSNSDGTAFLAEAFLNGEKVLYYGKDGNVKKIYEPNIISAVLISDGEEIAWISGGEFSTHCTVKKLKDGKITTLTNNASYYIKGGYPTTNLLGTLAGDSLVWNESYNEFTGSYTTYLHKDGKTAPLGMEIELRFFDYNGDRIFYEQGGALFVQSGYDTENRVLIADYSMITDDTQPEINNMKLYDGSFEDFNYVTLSQPDMSNIYVNALNRDDSQAIIQVSLYGDHKYYYYEEGKTPLFLTTEILEVVTPAGGSAAHDLSEYYFTIENEDRSYNVYRLDGGLKPVFDFPVLSIETFADTDKILYETEENLWIYDSLTGKSQSIYEHDKSSYLFIKAASDLSVIYVREREEGSSVRPLYAVFPDGTKTKIADDTNGCYLDGEKLYYTAPGYVLYVYENGNSEKIISFGKYHDTIVRSLSIRDTESGYLEIAVYTDPKDGDTSNTQNYYISIDGKNFVNIMDYLK